MIVGYGWKKKQYPKNLTMALMAEVGELGEHFMWADQNASHGIGRVNEAVHMELADVLIYAFQLATELELDVTEIVQKQLTQVQKKYSPKQLQGLTTQEYKKQQEYQQ